jgi:PTH1 family peptidyl-tRNA hydrolase
MKLIVGLGNPGEQYALTRHNSGFMAIDYLHNFFGCDAFANSRQGDASYCKGVAEKEQIILFKPQTFMNLSGKAVQSIAGFYKIPPEEIIVIYDDVSIPFGTMRIRDEGSAGGHNGMKSIIECIGTKAFTRIRLGIKPRIPFPGLLEDYVLGKCSAAELTELTRVIKKLPDALLMIFSQGVKAAMNKFNE